MADYLVVEGNSSLVRDVQTGAILNRNSAEFEAYKIKRDKNLNIRKQIEENAEDIRKLKDDISDIKSMILQLLTKV